MTHHSELAADRVRWAAQLLRRTADRAGHIVAVSSADLSAQGGEPPLRAAAQPWRDLRPDQLADPQAFEHDPKQIWEWYAWQRELVAQSEPGSAHRIVAEIEARAENFALVTESIDGLHQRAGSRKVVELRGSIWRMRCTEEGAVFTDTRVPLPELPPLCTCGKLLRPDVVWHGEALAQEVLDEALGAARHCDLMLAIGTSGLTQPAASLPITAKRAGASVIEINPVPTRISWAMDAVLAGRPEEVLPRLWPLDQAASPGQATSE